MNSRNEDKFFSLTNPIIYGILGTVSLFIIYVWLASSRSCQKGVCQSNFKHFLASSPNEIGDTLAGIAGILAFLWIITTVFLQSKELRIARYEYEKMADAQRDQVKLLVKQGEIFEKEQVQRIQNENKDILDQMLIGIWDGMTTFPINFVSWMIPEECYEDLEFSDEAPLFKMPVADYFDTLERPLSAPERETIIRQQARSLNELIDELEQCCPFMSQANLPEKPDELSSLIFELQKIRELENDLSDAQKKRLENLKIADIHFSLRIICDKIEWWRNHDEGTP